MSSYNQNNEKLPTRGVSKPVKTTDQAVGKKRNKKKKSNRALYYIFIVLFLVVVGVVLSLTVFFKTEEIVVVGNEHYIDQDIITSSGLTLETNLFLTPTKNIPEIIETTYPYIEKAQVNKMFPNSINIVLTSAEVMASLHLDGEEYALISDTGKILERGLVLLPPDAILVKGLSIGDKQPGDFLGDFVKEEILDTDSESIEKYKISLNTGLEEQAAYEKESLKTIGYLLTAIEETGFENLTNLNLADPLNMSVVFEGRLLLELGTEKELAYKLSFVKEAVAKLDSRAQGTMILDNVVNNGKAYYQPAEGFNIHGQPLEETITLPSDEDIILDEETTDE